MRTCGPMTENGPISTSTSISAAGSTEAVSAMRAVITGISNCCQRLAKMSCLEFFLNRQDAKNAKLKTSRQFFGVLRVLGGFIATKRRLCRAANSGLVVLVARDFSLFQKFFRQ